jgi:DNA-directed RNA polymerase subunit RPC12/RpoP
MIKMRTLVELNKVTQDLCNKHFDKTNGANLESVVIEGVTFIVLDSEDLINVKNSFLYCYDCGSQYSKQSDEKYEHCPFCNEVELTKQVTELEIYKEELDNYAMEVNKGKKVITVKVGSSGTPKSNLDVANKIMDYIEEDTKE